MELRKKRKVMRGFMNSGGLRNEGGPLFSHGIFSSAHKGFGKKLRILAKAFF
jgi:hypothetical protein